MNEASAILQIEDLRFGYPGGGVFLGPLDLAVGRGELWGVLGPNGSGKSTLLRLGVGLLSPTQGRVLLNGQPIGAVSPSARARQVAFLPQRPEAPPAITARQLVLLGRHPYRRYPLFESSEDFHVAEDALRQTRIAALADRTLDTLSGGEAQRVHLAAALAQQPRVLVLDEPTSALDPYHQLQIFSILRTLAREQGLAVLAATHDLNLAGQFCDRLLLLSNGREARRGPPDEVLDPELLASVYGVKFWKVDGGGPHGHASVGHATPGAGQANRPWVLPVQSDTMVSSDAKNAERQRAQSE